MVRGDETGLRAILPDLSANVPPEQYAALAGVTVNYLLGRFDILGSGWLSSRYGSIPAGREGHRYDSGPPVDADRDGAWLEGRVSPKNLPTARNMWRLIEGPYEPIDWQLDARSGARWSATVHSLDTPIGRRRGADVKAPWEVGKLQHLPRLALAYGLALRGEPGFQIASEYKRGYRNQVCDFLALNPPRYGVNWSTAMLAGIRVANLVVAHDMFKAAGAKFDQPFESLIERATRAHVQHIFQYMDWWDLNARNNHYLANVAGLSFAAAYLPTSPFSKTVLAFARREVDAEIAHQFTPEGSHFEGSTAYHAFSAEMMAWSVAVLCAADAPSDPADPRMVPSEARSRAFKSSDTRDLSHLREAVKPMAAFVADMTRPDGRLLQIGDNDSGRFLKLDVIAGETRLSAIRRTYLNLRELQEDDAPYWQEDLLDYSYLDGMLAAVSGEGDDLEIGVSYTAARAYVREEQGTRFGDSLLTNGTAQNPHSVSRHPAGPSVNVIRKELLGRKRVKTCSQEFVSLECTEGQNASLLDGLERVSYPDFGVCLFRSPRLWLAIRVGGHHLADGGHSHADALSFELHIDGRAYRVDPGSYVYTSLPWRRRQFRSDAAHGIPRLRGQVASEESENIFTPAVDGASTLLAFDDSGLAGCRETEQGVVFRVFELRADGVEVVDLSTDGQPILVEPLPWWSPGYGHLTAFDSGAGYADSDAQGHRRVERRTGLERRQPSNLLEQDARSARRLGHGLDRRSA